MKQSERPLGLQVAIVNPKPSGRGNARPHRASAGRVRKQPIRMVPPSQPRRGPALRDVLGRHLHVGRHHRHDVQRRPGDHRQLLVTGRRGAEHQPELLRLRVQPQQSPQLRDVVEGFGRDPFGVEVSRVFAVSGGPARSARQWCRSIWIFRSNASTRRNSGGRRRHTSQDVSWFLGAH